MVYKLNNGDVAQLGVAPALHAGGRRFKSSRLHMKKLDLHKTFHEDAERKTIRFIEESWDSGEEVEIITGNSQVMKELVINILDEYDLTYQIGRIFDLNNKGYIVILME